MGSSPKIGPPPWVPSLTMAPSSFGLLVPNLLRIRRAQLVLSSHWHHTFWRTGDKDSILCYITFTADRQLHENRHETSLVQKQSAEETHKGKGFICSKTEEKCFNI